MLGTHKETTSTNAMPRGRFCQGAQTHAHRARKEKRNTLQRSCTRYLDTEPQTLENLLQSRNHIVISDDRSKPRRHPSQPTPAAPPTLWSSPHRHNLKAHSHAKFLALPANTISQFYNFLHSTHGWEVAPCFSWQSTTE